MSISRLTAIQHVYVHPGRT